MKSFLITIYGWILAIIMIYLSGWLLFLKPLIDLINCEVLTGGFIAALFLKLLFALPVARVIGIIGTIVSIKIFM